MILILIFTAILLYYTISFIQILVKMKQDIKLPATKEEMAVIRKDPQRELKESTYSGQKGGIILYISFLLFNITTLVLAINFMLDAIFPSIIPFLYPLFLMPMLLNQFAFVKDGVLSGARFIPWKRIHSYEFIKIDVNHRYYGHSKKVNDQLELRLKTRFWRYKCIIMTEEMKTKVIDLLEEHGIEHSLEEIVSES